MGMINEYIFPVSSEDESVFYQIAAENFETVKIRYLYKYTIFIGL